MKFYAPHVYVSPRYVEGGKLTRYEYVVREVSWELKAVGPGPKGDPIALLGAAHDMAEILPAGWVTLVPCPSSKGDREANLTIARAIAARRPQTRVADVLRRRTPVESSRARRAAGGWSLAPQEHTIYAVARPPGRVAFVDNVIATGNTMRAARRAVGKGVGLAWAIDPVVLKATNR